MHRASSYLAAGLHIVLWQKRGRTAPGSWLLLCPPAFAAAYTAVETVAGTAGTANMFMKPCCVCGNQSRCAYRASGTEVGACQVQAAKLTRRPAGGPLAPPVRDKTAACAMQWPTAHLALINEQVVGLAEGAV